MSFHIADGLSLLRCAAELSEPEVESKALRQMIAKVAIINRLLRLIEEKKQWHKRLSKRDSERVSEQGIQQLLARIPTMSGISVASTFRRETDRGNNKGRGNSRLGLDNHRKLYNNDVDMLRDAYGNTVLLGIQDISLYYKHPQSHETLLRCILENQRDTRSSENQPSINLKD
jgi:hypothetical protein